MQNNSSFQSRDSEHLPDLPENFNHPARRELTFLFCKLKDIVTTNHDCYLAACNGVYCIIDRYRPAIAGSKVLFELSGRYDWAQVYRSPERLVTGSGHTLEGNLLDEVTIIGVAIREVIPAHPASCA